MAFNNFVYNNQYGHYRRSLSIDSCGSDLSSSSSSSRGSSVLSLTTEDAKKQLTSMWSSLEKKLQHPRIQEAQWMQYQADRKTQRRD